MTVKKARGVEMIAAERKRQVEMEGWTPEHDAEHTDHSLAQAAACYAVPQDRRGFLFADLWPDSWDESWWKPSADRVRELVKAGALIAAEIDRLLALAPAAPPRVSPRGKKEKLGKGRVR